VASSWATWTGRGQIVDGAIYEAVLAMMESLVTEYDKAGVVRQRSGAILPKSHGEGEVAMFEAQGAIMSIILTI
jgi:crotonobetainyl-CoA:carnitine CoA-transferase CaiB-like acyl-CoA transferase